jgi:hypothetical protein
MSFLLVSCLAQKESNEKLVKEMKESIQEIKKAGDDAERSSHYFVCIEKARNKEEMLECEQKKQ